VKSSSVADMMRNLNWRQCKSVLAVLGVIVAPALAIIYLVLQGYLFPEPFYWPNRWAIQAYQWMMLLFLAIGCWDISDDELHATPPWEKIVKQTWLIVTIIGISLCGLFVWLGVAGPWKPRVVDGATEAFKDWRVLYFMSGGTCFFPIIGRLCVFAKDLVRKENLLAIGFVFVFVVILEMVGSGVSGALDHSMMDREAVTIRHLNGH
jgi:hypothetical protein